MKTQLSFKQNLGQSQIKYRLFLNSRKKGFEFLIINLIGNSLTFLLNFTLPLIVNNDTYGYFALVFSIFNFCAAIFTFGLDSTIFKFVIEKRSDINILLIIVSAWFLLSLCGIFVLGVISYFIIKIEILKITYSYLLIVIFAAAFISLQRILLSYYIAKEKRKSYGQLFIINKLIQFIFIIITVIYFEADSFIELLPYLFLIQGVAIILFIFFKEQKNILWYVPKKKEVYNIIRFTLPLSINTISGIGFSYGFNVIISPLISLSQIGILNLYTQLSSIASMTINAMNNGHIPKFYKNFHSKPKQSILQYLNYIAINAIPIFLATFLFGFIYKYVSYRNVDDYNLLALSIYCFGIFFYSFKSIGSNLLIIKGKTMKISLITLVTSFVNIVSAFIITKYYGFVGCIISLSCGYVLQVFIFNYECFKYLNLSKQLISKLYK